MKAGILLMTLAMMPATARADLTSLTEIEPEGEAIPLSTSSVEIPVDVHSRIDIRFDASRFAEMNSPSGKHVDPALRQEVADASARLKSLEQDISTYLKDSADLRASLGRSEDDSTRQELRKRIHSHYSLISWLRGYAAQFLPPQTTNEFDFDPQTRVEKYMSAVSSHVAQISSALDDQVMQIYDDQKVAITAWCWHQHPGHPDETVHLENFDTQTPSNREPVPNFTFSPTPDQERELAESRQFNESLLATVKKIAQDGHDLQQESRNLSLEISSAVATIKSLATLRQATARFSDDAKALLANDPNAAPLKQNIEDIKQEIAPFENVSKALDQAITDYQNKARSGAQSLALSGLLTSVRAQAKTLSPQNMGKTLDSLHHVALSFRGNLANLAPASDPFLHERVTQDLSDLEQRVIPASLNADLNAIAGRLQDIDSMMTGLTQRLQAARSVESVALPPMEKPEGRLSVMASKQPQTFIDVQHSAWSEGDTYTLTVEVSNAAGATTKESYRFRARRYGWYNDWSDSLAFAKGSWSDHFQPAVAVSWTLHHRSKPEYADGRIRGGTGILGDTVDLGLDVNSMLFSTDKDVEVGLGAGFSLFHGVLQFGAGWNFQQYPKPFYAYAAASLFNIFRQGQSVGSAQRTSNSVTQ